MFNIIAVKKQFSNLNSVSGKTSPNQFGFGLLNCLFLIKISLFVIFYEDKCATNVYFIQPYNDF